MPPPRDDRQAWVDELKELRGMLAQLRRELSATTEENGELRKVLTLKIARAEKRATNLRARLAPPPDA